MKKVPYKSNRNYRDLGWEEETPEEPLNIENLKKIKKSKFESFKNTFKNLFKK